MGLCRYIVPDAPETSLWGFVRGDSLTPLNASAVQRALLGKDPEGLSSLARFATGAAAVLLSEVRVLPPTLPGTEIWAAGVTYESSKYARMSESEGGGDFYARVYVADRPELFFKATPHRTVGHGAPVRIREDSRWNVPEPEFAVAVAPTGEILGYTIGNDMSSRDIEGANPLYLPQAKVYLGSCSVGPWIVPANEIDPANCPIRLRIERSGATAFEGETSTARMRRTPKELVGWAMRENAFPGGLVLLTGTGIIPPDDFTLLPGDTVSIEVEGIGTLRNSVQ